MTTVNKAIALIVVILVLAFVTGWVKSESPQKVCESKGGVHIKGKRGNTICVKREAVIVI